MFSRIAKRRHSDRADSTVVTFVLVFPLFFAFLITMIDTSVYFANRSVVQQISRDGARTIAIFGGNGDATTQSPLERSYGQPISCSSAQLDKTAHRTSVECNVLRRLEEGSGLTNVTFAAGAVNCGPVRAQSVGETTYCQVTWRYGGIPGSTMNFISVGRNDTTGKDGSLFTNNTTRVTSESEVGMAGINFVAR